MDSTLLVIALIVIIIGAYHYTMASADDSDSDDECDADEIYYGDDCHHGADGGAFDSPLEIALRRPYGPHGTEAGYYAIGSNDHVRDVIAESDRLNGCYNDYAAITTVDRTDIICAAATAPHHDTYVYDRAEYADEFWRNRERYGANANVYTALPRPCIGVPAPSSVGLYVGRREPFLTQPDEAFNAAPNRGANAALRFGPATTLLYRDTMGLDISDVDMTSIGAVEGVNGYRYKK